MPTSTTGILGLGGLDEISEVAVLEENEGAGPDAVEFPSVRAYDAKQGARR
jgi:hypothetical protein